VLNIHIVVFCILPVATEQEQEIQTP